MVNILAQFALTTEIDLITQPNLTQKEARDCRATRMTWGVI
jgi:hypothetical protein